MGCVCLGLHIVFSASGLHKASIEQPPQPARRGTRASLLPHHIYPCSVGHHTFVHTFIGIYYSLASDPDVAAPNTTWNVSTLCIAAWRPTQCNQQEITAWFPDSSKQDRSLDEHQPCAPTNQQSHHSTACSPQLPSSGESITDFLS